MIRQLIMKFSNGLTDYTAQRLSGANLSQIFLVSIFQQDSGLSEFQDLASLVTGSEKNIACQA